MAEPKPEPQVAKVLGFCNTCNLYKANPVLPGLGYCRYNPPFPSADLSKAAVWPLVHGATDWCAIGYGTSATYTPPPGSLAE